MPRVENLGKNVMEWNKRTGDGSSTHDLCQKCYKKLTIDPHALDNVLKPYGYTEPRGELGWQGDVEHPLYNGEDCYLCESCGVKLNEIDNNASYP